MIISRILVKTKILTSRVQTNPLRTYGVVKRVVVLLDIDVAYRAAERVIFHFLYTSTKLILLTLMIIFAGSS